MSKSGAEAAGNLELGRRIYNFRCYYCHGYSGNARTLAATLLDPKPLDFTGASPDSLGRERMMQSIRTGRPGTSMMSFAGILQPHEIAAVTDFVRQEFMVAKAENTRYHTEANGWSNHQRYAAAFPFATGRLALDTPWEQLTPQQADGKRLFMTSCVSCHDRALVNQKGMQWESRPLSYPRNQFSPGDDLLPGPRPASSVDAMTSASPYLLHDRPPRLSGLSETEKRGEILFQNNCAFCHAADGTARNWIGSFMEPHPRDLTNPKAMSGMTRTRLRTVIREGLPGTSMPAWKSVLSEQQVEDVIAYVGRAFHPLEPEK
ncbi:MAG: cytochrome c class I [Betaproteobacteria bacterium RBG_16_56_24]|nr:MAG: cytochrome c class I [Betaproteobacteria bacterium RBG_16_56_24]